MWSRKELKEKGRKTFSRNYWKTVLVSVILSLIIGSGSVGSSFASGFSDGFSDGISDAADTISEVDDYDDSDSDYDYDDYDDADYSDEAIDEAFGVPGPEVAAIAIFLIVFVIAFVLIMTIVIIIDAFVVNPLEIGIRRFGIANLNTKAEVKEIGFGFDHNYKNGVKAMFLKDLYTFLWSLLFVIPGIVKSYEYRMIPYLLADHPDMTYKQAFAESRRMMSGQKWRAFVLDLSFIGWDILSILTLGILSIFYVEPYRFMTNAALYEALAYGSTAQDDVTIDNIGV